MWISLRERIYEGSKGSPYRIERTVLFDCRAAPSFTISSAYITIKLLKNKIQNGQISLGEVDYLLETKAAILVRKEVPTEENFGLKTALIKGLEIRLQAYLPMASDRLLCSVYHAMRQKKGAVINAGCGRIIISSKGKMKFSPTKARDKAEYPTGKIKVPYDRSAAADLSW